MPKRYRKLRGDTAYYPFAARTGLRARQRRHVRVLRGAGLAALALAAVLLVRQTVFRGGQPDAPAAVPTAPAVTALPAPTHVTVQPLAATRDALADTQRADAGAHTTPETAAAPAPAADAGEILPQYRELYEKNSDLIGWLRIDGTDIDLPVVQTPGDNEYYLRRGFDRFYAVGGTLFLDERCSVSADAPTANTDAPVLDVKPLLALADAGDHAGMVDSISPLLFGGGLSAETRATMVAMLDKLKTANRSSQERVQSLVQLALASPEFAVQR